MTTYEKNETNRLYFSIVGGEFALPVPEGTPNSRLRKWEAGGRSGQKTEVVYRSLTGRIQDISFYQGEKDGQKFTTLNLVLDEDENKKTPVISVNVDTKYCKDLLKKLPNVDFAEEIKFRPFSFTPDGEDRNIIGIEVLQRDSVIGQFSKKISSYFHKKVDDKWTNVNGYPSPEGDTKEYTSDDWKVYGIQVKKFLMNHTQVNLIPKFQKNEGKEVEEDVEEDTDDPRLEDMPF